MVHEEGLASEQLADQSDHKSPEFPKETRMGRRIQFYGHRDVRRTGHHRPRFGNHDLIRRKLDLEQRKNGLMFDDVVRQNELT